MLLCRCGSDKPRARCYKLTDPAKNEQRTSINQQLSSVTSTMLRAPPCRRASVVKRKAVTSDIRHQISAINKQRTSINKTPVICQLSSVTSYNPSPCPAVSPCFRGSRKKPLAIRYQQSTNNEQPTTTPVICQLSTIICHTLLRAPPCRSASVVQEKSH